MAWSSHWSLIRLMDLGLINLRYLLILVMNWRLMNLLSDCWSNLRRNNWNWIFDWVWRQLKMLIWSAI